MLASAYSKQLARQVVVASFGGSGPSQHPLRLQFTYPTLPVILPSTLSPSTTQPGTSPLIGEYAYLQSH